MATYLLSTHTSAEASPRGMSDQQMREGFARVGALEDEMRSKGALVASGRLEEAAQAAVVRVADGRTITTDGPFVEAKEVLGGFYIIDAPSHEAALEWASKTSAAIGMPIEVRGFFGFRTETPALEPSGVVR
jgi:hypothetical protein